MLIFFAIVTKNWLPNNQRDLSTKKVVMLLRKIVDMLEFDLGQLIFNEFFKFSKVNYKKYILPYLSLIFQVLFSQDSELVKPKETYEKIVSKLKFSCKWLEGKHVINE